MRKEQVIKETYEYIKKIFSSDVSGHDFWHIYRVWNTAKHIAKTEKVDSFVVQMAALLHDLGDYKLEKDHKDRQKEKVSAYLGKIGVLKKDKENILDIVLNMSFSKNVTRRQKLSKEGKIVQDADRLDAMGAIGIARAFVYAGVKGVPMYNPNEKIKFFKSSMHYRRSSGSGVGHFYEKLLKLKKYINTRAGKKMAENRHKFMQDYLKHFFIEWKGEGK